MKWLSEALKRERCTHLYSLKVRRTSHLLHIMKMSSCFPGDSNAQSAFLVLHLIQQHSEIISIL